MSITEKMLGILTGLTPQIINLHTNIHGLRCDVYYPLKEDLRVYDDSDKIRYAKEPSLKQQKFLVLNFMNKDAFRGSLNQFEGFFADKRPYILTYGNKRIPPRSRVEVYLGAAKQLFQTEIDYTLQGVLIQDEEELAEHETLVDNSTIMIRQILRPLT